MVVLEGEVHVTDLGVFLEICDGQTFAVLEGKVHVTDLGDFPEICDAQILAVLEEKCMSQILGISLKSVTHKVWLFWEEIVRD